MFTVSTHHDGSKILTLEKQAGYCIIATFESTCPLELMQSIVKQLNAPSKAGSTKSERKATSSKANGTKGGRPNLPLPRSKHAGCIDHARTGAIKITEATELCLRPNCPLKATWA